MLSSKYTCPTCSVLLRGCGKGKELGQDLQDTLSEQYISVVHIMNGWKRDWWVNERGMMMDGGMKNLGG